MTRQTANGMWVAIPYGDRRCFALVEASGEAVPQLCFDGEVPQNVAAAADGGFFVWGGHGFTPNVPPPAWIARFDRSRRVLWARRIDAANSVLPTVAAGTPDGGIILGGGYGAPGQHPCKKCQSSFVLKMSDTGSVEWLHVFDVPNFEDITAVVPMRDGYIVAGTTEPGAWLAKLDARVKSFGVAGSHRRTKSPQRLYYRTAMSSQPVLLIRASTGSQE